MTFLEFANNSPVLTFLVFLIIFTTIDSCVSNIARRNK